MTRRLRSNTVAAPCVSKYKTTVMDTYQHTVDRLGDKAGYLLDHVCEKIPKDRIRQPNARTVEEVFAGSDRPTRVLGNLARIYDHGTLGGTGYLSILPVDQGVEHSAAYSFYPNPDFFDPETIIRLALEGGCNAVASTFGVLGLHARRYAHRIPFIVKLNHKELLTYPRHYDQTLYGTVREAWNLGAAAVGATVYFGSSESRRQLEEISAAFAEAHSLGMGTILWCYTRNMDFKTEEQDYHAAADLTGQANYLGVTIQADIIKQKLPDTDYGFRDLDFGKYDAAMYERLTTDHPIDRCRLQVANCYLGKIGMLNSGGSSGGSDTEEAVRTAVINKRAGGVGLIMGRKSFQKPFAEGLDILRAVQEVYLEDRIGLA